MLCDRKGFSQRRACQIVGQHRSTQRHRPECPDPDSALRAELRAFARRHPRWGYRRAHAVLRRQGHHRVNRKKVQRLWREEGLRVPPRRHKRQRLGISTTAADRLVATHPDHVWALDYQFDVTTTGRTINRSATVLPCCWRRGASSGGARYSDCSDTMSTCFTEPSPSAGRGRCNRTAKRSSGHRRPRKGFAR